MYNKSKFVFWVTLVLYITTLCTVSYVGVYLTYIAIPLIVISGLIMKLSKPKKYSKRTSEIGKATSTLLNEISTGINSVNSSLEKHKEKNVLINQRTEILREKRNKLNMEKINPEIVLKYAKAQHEIVESNEIISSIDFKIEVLDTEIDEIKKQCELEIEQKYLTNV